MKTNRLYSYVIILAIALWHMPAWGNGYNLQIGGTEVTSDNYANISAASGFSAVQKGMVSYDHASNTLTLNNATIKASKDVSAIKMFAAGKPFIIKLVGHNILETSGTGDAVSTFFCSLRLTGDGTLEASANLAITSGNYLTLDGGCTIEVEAPIWASQTIVINDAKVHAKAKVGEPALSAFGGIELRSGSYVADPEGATCEQWNHKARNGKAYVYLKDGKPCDDVLIKRGKNTGIENAATPPPTKEDVIYTLDGVRMKLPFERLPKGVYIVNGKKVKKE
jgi:putative arginine-specific protease argI polyprotein